MLQREALSVGMERVMKKALSLIALILLFGSISSFSQITVPSNGTDIGAQINAAAASLPSNGGKILVQTQASGLCYSFSVPIVITKAVILEGEGPSTCLNYGGSGAAVSFSGNTSSLVPAGTYVDGFGLRDLTILGAGPTSGQIGLALGGPGNSVGFYGTGLTISNFGLGLQFGRGVWNFKIEHSIFGANGQNLYYPSSLQFGGENLEFDNVTFIGSTFVNSVQINDADQAEFSNLNNLTFVSCNFDKAQLVLNHGSGAVRLYSSHFENVGGSGSEPFVRIVSYNGATDVVMDGPDFYNDQNDPYPPSFIEIDGGPTVTITQMRSVNLDGTTNVPANLVINGSPDVTLIGDAFLRAAKQQYIVQSGSPHMWVMGGRDSSNVVNSNAPLMYSQTYGPDNQSPVVAIGGSGYQPTVGFNLWAGSGSSYYGMQIRETGPNELDFCSGGLGPLGSDNYVCNAGVTNGVFKSTVPDGIPPLSVASHTPPVNLNAWPATFDASGAQIQNPHITTGKVILPAHGRATVNFNNAASFTQTPVCTVTYQAPFFIALPPIANPTAKSISILGQQYIGVYFVCIGN